MSENYWIQLEALQPHLGGPRRGRWLACVLLNGSQREANLEAADSAAEVLMWSTASLCGEGRLASQYFDLIKC